MRLVLTAAVSALFLLFTACGSEAEPLATPTQPPTFTPVPTATVQPTATPRPMPTPTAAPTLTPVPSEIPAPAKIDAPPDEVPAADIIVAAIDAMNQVESFRAEVDASFKVVQTEASFRMDEETFGMEFPIRFAGDFQMPDRAAGNLQVALGVAVLELDIVTIGEQAYITNPETGVWEQYPLFLTGLPNPYDLVLPPADTSLYSDVEVVKDQTVNDVLTRHIRANLRANVLGGSYDRLYFDIWIGQEDNLIYRLTMAGNAKTEEEDTAGLAASVLDIGGEAEFNMAITYSDFNQPIVIEPPIP